MELPRYAIIGCRPVKALRTLDGGMTIRALNWATMKFEKNMNYLTQMMFGYGNIEFVTKEEFDKNVEALQGE